MKRLCVLLIALSIVGCNKENLFEPGVSGPKGSGDPKPPPHQSATAYRFVIGTGLLAGLDGPNADPVRTTASSTGDSILIRGEGTFSVKPQNKGKATGQGTFIVKNAAGNIVGTGTWVAKELMSFESYGDGTLQGLPNTFEGGLALIRVRIPEVKRYAVLRVQSLLGSPPAGAHEGISLAVDHGPTFDHIVSGSTAFIRTD